MKLFETTKLHYNKYLYKLVIINSCAPYFRTDFQKDGQYRYAREKLDNIHKHHNPNKHNIIIPFGRWSEYIPTEHYYDAITIFRYLKNTKEKDFLVRVERNTMYLYSNNRNWLIKLGNKIKQPFTEFWEPNPENLSFLQDNKNVIVVKNKPEYLYKCTFGKKPGNSSLASWIDNNPSLAKIGDVAKEECYNQGWVKGYYFWVKNEKALFIVQMIAGDNIVRVDKLVYNND